MCGATTPDQAATLQPPTATLDVVNASGRDAVAASLETVLTTHGLTRGSAVPASSINGGGVPCVK